MAYVTKTRQDTQIRNSDLYDDTIAPSQAAFETNPVEIETDLNNIRSQLSNLLDDQAGNWWDDLNVPSALDTGLQRGVNDLNTALHAVEKKRVLRDVFNLADISVGASTASTGTLTLTANAADSETVTTGTDVYTFKTALTPTAFEVLIGGTASDSLDNLIAAINLGAGAGSLYAATTTANSFVSAAAGAGDTMDLTALVPGVVGDSIATTETMTNGSFGGATLSGGADGDNLVILGGGELPTNTTAAVGAVTTLGTVVAAHGGTFGTHALSEVAGGNALSPLNLMGIVDGDTRDPILSGNRIVYGLLQVESGVTDGVTITDTTTTRAQVSLVRVNAAGDDLEAAPFADVAGKTINYSTRERVRLEDLNEFDFLKGAIVDIPPSGATVDLQTAINNQGSTPVDVTTNITTDLEGPGLEYCWRDDNEANLLCIIEGSASGTSEIEFGSDIDIFDNDAVLNDFLNGASFDTGAAGTTINIGTTANQIDSGGVLSVASGGGADLSLVAALEMNLTDSYRAGSTWSLADGIALANSSAEWTDFETEFGEVSLLDAIVAAKNTTGRRKAYATVTVTAAADTDVSLSDGNLDAALGDLSAGTFVDDYDIYLNGKLLFSGANAAANNDVYPGTSLAAGQLRFEDVVKIGDVVAVVDWIG